MVLQLLVIHRQPDAPKMETNNQTLWIHIPNLRYGEDGDYLCRLGGLEGPICLLRYGGSGSIGKRPFPSQIQNCIVYALLSTGGSTICCRAPYPVFPFQPLWSLIHSDAHIRWKWRFTPQLQRKGGISGISKPEG